MAAQRAHRGLVGAGGAAQAQVDAIREKGGQGAELFGNRQRRVVGQHDAARADANRLGGGRQLPDQHRRGRAGHAVHIVVFGDPEAAVAEGVGMLCEGNALPQGIAGIAAFDDGGEVEDG